MSIDPKMLISRLKLEIAEPSRWIKCRSTSDQVRVYYGMDDVVFGESIQSGGAVKLQDLSRPYPNTVNDPNVLYLVSSALPPHGPRIASIAKKYGAKVVLNQNGVAYPACYPDDWQEFNCSMKALINMADHVFYQSEFCKKGADEFLGKCSGSCEVLYNPVDTNTFVPRPHQRATGSMRLLLAGSHCDEYRVRVAIQTVSVLRKKGVECSMTVAGRYKWKPDERDCLVEARSIADAEGVSDSVKFQGAYTQQEAVPLFQSADILLHTKYNDPCPRLVVEGMACGLPVVYSASGGVPELVGGDAGVGVPSVLDWEKVHAPSPDALAEAVCQVMTSLGEMSDSARDRACRLFGVKPWIDRHRSIFERCLKCH